MVENIRSGLTGGGGGVEIGADAIETVLEETVSGSSPERRIPARIGALEFTYEDPAVNITTEQRTVEHETLDNDIVVQTLGRKPDQISIDGTVTESELFVVDNLVRNGVLQLRTERWKGKIIVKSASTDFRRAKSKEGQWLYDATIECVEVEEGE